MPKPSLTRPATIARLHKRKRNPDTVTIYGSNIAVNYEVNLNGTRGQRPTNWSGTITRQINATTFESNNVVVDNEEVSKSSGHRTTAGGSEDVAVTVTNSTDTSDPVITPAVTTVP